ncbi:MAG: hypothetical protein HYZ29_34040 [Myxococcales bacterium]|nr:hypothetical protein [Myxococcales bacterium]
MRSWRILVAATLLCAASCSTQSFHPSDNGGGAGDASVGGAGQGGAGSAGSGGEPSDGGVGNWTAWKCEPEASGPFDLFSQAELAGLAPTDSNTALIATTTNGHAHVGLTVKDGAAKHQLLLRTVSDDSSPLENSESYGLGSLKSIRLFDTVAANSSIELASEVDGRLARLQFDVDDANGGVQPTSGSLNFPAVPGDCTYGELTSVAYSAEVGAALHPVFGCLSNGGVQSLWMYETASDIVKIGQTSNPKDFGAYVPVEYSKAGGTHFILVGGGFRFG